MEIRRFESDLLSSNMYLIVEGNAAIVIDPFRDITPAADLNIEKIILTHEHYDHISGVNHWKERKNAPVLCSEACAENIVNARKNLSRLFDVFCELQTWVEVKEMSNPDLNYSCEADEVFSDKMDLSWHGHSFQLFAMPGHSPGSIGILLDNQHFFSGDSLMENQKIELRLPGGSRKQWKLIGVPRLKALPDGINVYPGHFSEYVYRAAKGRE